MRVLRAGKLGFCFGVENAVKLAEGAVAKRGAVYALGPIIHNNQAIERLTQQGLITVGSLREVQDGTVLIRAHGVSPKDLTAIRKSGKKVVDATCILIRRAQKIVKELHGAGFQVVMIGDANHAEVKAMAGYAPNIIVVNSSEDLEHLPKNGKLGIVAQTTLSQQHLATIISKIALRQFREIRVVNTLCPEVVRRQQAAMALCREVDVMFVLGDRHSANTRELASLCRQQGVPTHRLESWKSFRAHFVNECSIAGVTAGASTPPWVTDEFVKHLKDL